MDVIANAVGVSKKTLYVHFKGKEDLLYQSFSAEINSRRALYRQTIDSAPNIIEGIFALVKVVIRDMNGVNPLVFDELRRYYPQVFENLTRSQRDTDYKQMSQLIEKGKRQGLILKDLDTDIVTKLFLSQIQYVNDNELFPADRYSRTDLFRHIFINFIRGISTLEGQLIIKEFTKGD